MAEKQTVFCTDLGIQRYKPVWDLQEKLLAETVAVKTAYFDADPVTRPTQHRLLLVEHPPVYTLGKSGHVENILISEEEMQQRGIDFFKINRGGDITFHGLQQLVGYPIIDLEKFYTDIGKYLRALEEVIIRTIAHFGIVGGRSPGETGVWIEPGIKGYERKICAMGVRTSRWVTMHGWALNVNTDLSYFDHIIPCGIRDKEVTSMAREVGQEVDYNMVKQLLLKEFAEVFNVELIAEQIAMA